MFIILLLAYSLGVSYLLVRHQRGLRSNAELDAIWRSITSKPNPSADEIKAIAEVAKVRQGENPWYERSLSTIGTIAFFSMIIATTIQTINSAKAEVEVAGLRLEMKGLEAQRNTWKKLVKELADVIVLKEAAYGKIEKTEGEVLKQRLEQIDGIEKPGKEEDTEKLKIFLALKQYDEASALISKSGALVRDVPLDRLLSLAEISFVDGSKGQTTSLLNTFESQLSSQPVEWQLRYFVLRSALESDPKLYCKEVAALRGLSLDDAEQLLRVKIEELKRQALRRAGSTPSRTTTANHNGT